MMWPGRGRLKQLRNRLRTDGSASLLCSLLCRPMLWSVRMGMIAERVPSYEPASVAKMAGVKAWESKWLRSGWSASGVPRRDGSVWHY
jgi:hypothetical protein